MKDGFIKIAAVTPYLKVGDPVYNAEQMEILIAEAHAKGAKVIAFPELSLSAYTCGDLFLQDSLLKECRRQLKNLADFTRDYDALVFVGLPYEKDGKLYNVAAVLHRGLVLCMIPKSHIPNYSEFYEARYFTPATEGVSSTLFFDMEIPFGREILLVNESEPTSFTVSAEICEDAFVPLPPSTFHAMAGALLIVNLSASDEVVGKDEFRRNLLGSLSARLVSAYLYACAGEGESSQDLVFGGNNIIAENGKIISEAPLFQNQVTYGDIDIGRLLSERRKMNSFPSPESYGLGEDRYVRIPFRLDTVATRLSRIPERFPFVPEKVKDRARRCEEVLSIQALGLKKRLSHIGTERAVIGISGGLDSTLALLVTVRAFDSLGLDRQGISAVTMPCFGTTDRTYHNALKLIKALGARSREIDIKASVRQHFRDIGQDETLRDVTYENSQARERTQVLMDIANQNGGLVVGTGDLSELALGWATYNGDHMSMYGVNSGVPKTLVRHLVSYYADCLADNMLKNVLLDILDTPVSPELLPPEDGRISQQTEDLVGPYELHDFFLYYLLRYGFSPRKIYRLSRLAFDRHYPEKEILKWLKVFYRRFFTQQFKRSCLPDGPKVGTVAVSPRGDLRMPSDAAMNLWIREVEDLG
ncbi:MAG: NAD(+) synthase [Lachnospiraceae bacterium]|nr:NAD(+) synthase [Lachnospiraceae bacterium]